MENSGPAKLPLLVRIPLLSFRHLFGSVLRMFWMVSWVSVAMLVAAWWMFDNVAPGAVVIAAIDQHDAPWRIPDILAQHAGRPGIEGVAAALEVQAVAAGLAFWGVAILGAAVIVAWELALRTMRGTVAALGELGPALAGGLALSGAACRSAARRALPRLRALRAAAAGWIAGPRPPDVTG